MVLELVRDCLKGENETLFNLHFSPILLAMQLATFKGFLIHPLTHFNLTHTTRTNLGVQTKLSYLPRVSSNTKKRCKRMGRKIKEVWN